MDGRTLCVAAGAVALVAHARAQAPAADTPKASPTRAAIVVHAGDNTPAKLDHILPEVAGTRITVMKKSDVAKLDQAPPIVRRRHA